MVGNLERVPLRDVWPHEAKDFTTWLEHNIDVLNEVTDLTCVNSRPNLTTHVRVMFTTHVRVMFTTHVHVMFTTHVHYALTMW